MVAEPQRQDAHAREGALLSAMCIEKHYAGITALAGVSFEIHRGEILALAGENGSGKSTLIKIIAGVEKPDAGSLSIDGVDWTHKSPAERIGAGIQIIYQDFALFPNLSAGENVWLPIQHSQGLRIVARSKGISLAKRVMDEICVSIDFERPVS